MSGNLGIQVARRRIVTAVARQRLPWNLSRVTSPTAASLSANPRQAVSVLPWQPYCQHTRHYHQSPVRYDEKEAADSPAETTEQVDTESNDSEAPPPTEYSTPELTQDAAKHKAVLDAPDRPFYQNPLHHNNPDMQKLFREDFDSEEEFQANMQPQPPMDLGDGVPPAPEYLHELADKMVHLSVLEMNELVNKIADHYGFHEGILAPDDDGGDAVGEGGEEGGDAPAQEAKTAFDIKLVEFDAKAKIKVIKEVRALAGLGLKEAKELVEGAPKVIHKGVKQEEAEEIKAKLEELGATIEIV